MVQTPNSISEVTRRNIFDELRLAKVNWSGRLGDADFLSRVFDLQSLPSYDARRRDLAGDIQMHRYTFPDWDDDWVYDDARLNLLRCDDAVFLNFLSEMIHPVVRQSVEECESLLALFNCHLSADGFEISSFRIVSGRPIYSGQAKTAIFEVPAIAQSVAQDLNSQHVAAQITRMNMSMHSDPALAIGTAKEFVETICKGILSVRGIPRTGAEDIQKLVKMTREALNVEVSDHTGSTRKVMNGLATVVQGVAELRGAVGTGHGPEPDAAVPEPVLARLVVQAGVSLGVFFLDLHQKSPPALID